MQLGFPSNLQHRVRLSLGVRLVETVPFTDAQLPSVVSMREGEDGSH